MSKVAMIVRSKAAPGKRNELFELYTEHLAPRAEANPGQELVVWCADADDADAFTLFEIYSGPEVMQANANADWFQEYLGKAMPLMAGAPQVVMGEPRWSTGI